jgi:hypothetical protein
MLHAIRDMMKKPIPFREFDGSKDWLDGKTASNLAQLKGVPIDEVSSHTAMLLRLERLIERFDKILLSEDRELRENLRGVLRERKAGMGTRWEERGDDTIARLETSMENLRS